MEPLDFGLAGQVALVSGASRGIGHDLVLALAQAGAIVAAGARSADDVKALVAAVGDRGGRAIALEVDVTDLDSIGRGVRRVLDDEGKIDILVNNAGLGANHDAVDVTEADWDEMMDVNLKGLFSSRRPSVDRWSSVATGGSSASARRPAWSGYGATRCIPPARAV